MPAVLVCPHGHRWEMPTDAPPSESPVLCPVCGGAMEAAAVTEAETIPPVAAPVPAAETATVIKAALNGPIPMIPGYEILGELGRGGMGLVYRARQPHLDRLVAVKVLPAEASKDTSFAERFTREARALARLNHPNILTVYDFGQANGQSYFVMEYVDGSNLRQRLHAGPMPVSEALRIIRQVCDALQYAHEEGIVHRDIKPENVLLDRKGRAKIADFGIAKLLTRKTGEYTLTGPWQVMGTWHYMAPEQLENPQRLDHRADIYAVGVMLYELLTGSLPQGHFPLPSQKRGTDPWLDTIILKALEKEPERRYQSAGEMKSAIEACHRNAPPAPLAKAAAPSGSKKDDTAVLSSPVVPFSTHDAWVRRVRAPATVLIVAGMISFIPSIVLWIQRAASNAYLFKDTAGGFFTFVSPLAALIVIAGGVALYRRHSYTLAFIGSCVSMLPYTYTWPLGLCAGVVALATLTRRDVRRAYLGVPPERDASPSAIPTYPVWIKNITIWCTIVCVVGFFFCVQPWLPWASVLVYGAWNYPLDTPMASVGGFQPYAIVPAIFFAALFLALLVVGQRRARSLWGTVAILAVGLVTVGCTLLALLNIRTSLPGVLSLPGTSKNLGGQVVGAHVERHVLLLGGECKIVFDAYAAGLQGNTVWGGPHAAYLLENGRTETVMLANDIPFSVTAFAARLGVAAGVPVYATLTMGLCLVLIGALQLRGIVAGRQRIGSSAALNG